MRRILLAPTLFLAGCATAPQPQAPVTQPPPVVSAPQPRIHGNLIGYSAAELVGHFGNPALQVREGQGLKLQFRSLLCVLDAYLYPPATGSGPPRVTYIDTRVPSGANAAPAGCIDA